MTPRTSVRAQAREIYGELAADKVVAELNAALPPYGDAVTPTPDPSPQGGGEMGAVPGGGEKGAVLAVGEPHLALSAEDLTARIRALYEGSAVTVREIATIAGVTERTLYRYVEKHGWKKRYRVVPRGEAAAAANRGRGWRSAARFAPAKGSGGRFIRRDDKNKPFATGLKALDPAGRDQALARCAAAEPLAHEAQAAAGLSKQQEDRLRALQAVNRACGALANYRVAREQQRAARREAEKWKGDNWKRRRLPPPVPDNPQLERALELSLHAAINAAEAVPREG